MWGRVLKGQAAPNAFPGERRCMFSSTGSLLIQGLNSVTRVMLRYREAAGRQAGCGEEIAETCLK